MLIVKWEKLPKEMQLPEVKPYYDILRKKQLSLFFKRLFDVFASFLMLIILSPVFLILAIAIKIDSNGPVFYRQERITQYNKHFRIFKFRSMIQDADKSGLVTISNDKRITRVGAVIRKYKLDELCQLIDVLRGTMTFVGTRPEVPKYVEKYTNEMMATLLLPAGITSLASIKYKNEATLLNQDVDIDRVYLEEVLPSKMKYNLECLRNYSFGYDIFLILETVYAVLLKESES